MNSVRPTIMHSASTANNLNTIYNEGQLTSYLGQQSDLPYGGSVQPAKRETDTNIINTCTQSYDGHNYQHCFYESPIANHCLGEPSLMHPTVHAWYD